jgi:hypothetical protein
VDDLQLAVRTHGWGSRPRHHKLLYATRGARARAGVTGRDGTTEPSALAKARQGSRATGALAAAGSIQTPGGRLVSSAFEHFPSVPANKAGAGNDSKASRVRWRGRVATARWIAGTGGTRRGPARDSARSLPAAACLLRWCPVMWPHEAVRPPKAAAVWHPSLLLGESEARTRPGHDARHGISVPAQPIPYARARAHPAPCTAGERARPGGDRTS